MRRITLTVVLGCGLVLGVQEQAAAAVCVTPDPRPCAGVRGCSFGGDPDALYVTVKAQNKKQALLRADKAVANLRKAKVKPRVVDVIARAGKKRVRSKTYKLPGKHWRYSYAKSCWVVR
ncbi:hypothetical protein [Actinocorallia sp. A-T 12471]|uniref:hypothetical protein n=1 Tax=Actinocorallia sp. A-T 12471 TaxID=3089813 RepID=UPI0029D14613|nr:hypothetical protein [Actinocorallia sp. A-T 12471]MDX6742890.1 hypothetical protein [Actinocorallia sp. A-T 12471]